VVAPLKYASISIGFNRTNVVLRSGIESPAGSIGRHFVSHPL